MPAAPSGGAQRRDENAEDEDRHEEFQTNQPGIPGHQVRRPHQDFGEPLVVDPGSVRRERVRVRGGNRAGGDDVDAEANVPPQVGIGERAGKEKDEGAVERHTQQPAGVRSASMRRFMCQGAYMRGPVTVDGVIETGRKAVSASLRKPSTRERHRTRDQTGRF